MRLLLDSNVLLWSFADRKLLTPKVLTLIEDDTNELTVSRASIWEIAIKVAKGSLAIPGSSVSSLLDQIEMTGGVFLVGGLRYRCGPASAFTRCNESSIIELGRNAVYLSVIVEVLDRKVVDSLTIRPFIIEHRGGVAQMVRATDS